jgi:hypothetical protein
VAVQEGVMECLMCAMLLPQGLHIPAWSCMSCCSGCNAAAWSSCCRRCMGPCYSCSGTATARCLRVQLLLG